MAKKFSHIHKVALIGSYVPRKCGIATFTNDLYNALEHQSPEIQFPVVAMNDTVEGYNYPQEVRFEIFAPEIQNYQRAADFLNMCDPDVVCIQHEFGIFGGRAGSHLLALMKRLRMPIVCTLHTILKTPNDDQKKVFDQIISLSSKLVVMSNTGAEFLKEIYGVPQEKIEIIPHGIPDTPFVDPNFFKDIIGVEGRQVLLTFGLLSPNKGIESVIEALPDVCKKFPNIVYIILGATHPGIIKEQGETYRLNLQRLAKEKGVSENVIFHDRYVSLEELEEFIGAADIYITPYLNEAQITSGTLAYSFGMGKAVISTPYWHAKELLSDNRGVIVPFSSPKHISQAIIDLLSDEVKRHAMRKNAYKLGREMIWSNVAHLYISTFENVRAEFSSSQVISINKGLDYSKEANLPSWRFEHLLNMTDKVGILQHAIFTIPNFEHGYCTDDNARALILMILLEEIEEFKELKNITVTYAAFLNHAFNAEKKRFRNFMSFEKKWLEDVGSEDSHARAIWALGTCVGRSRNKGLRNWATRLFESALPSVEHFSSPRAMALTVIGLHEYLRTLSGDRLADSLRECLSQKLLDMFKNNATDDWFWLEDIVSYDNAKIPHALILTGRWKAHSEMFETGISALKWLTKNQSSPRGYFYPIGSNGFWKKNSPPARFDQQPIEAQSMINACAEAYRTTNDEFWLAECRKAFDWFLGGNELNLPLYDPHTGGCHDGLHMDRINQNQGAESTLAFLLSLVEMYNLRNTVIAFENKRTK